MKKYKLGVYEKAMPSDLPFSERLAQARQTGYDYMELSVDESDVRLARLDWTAAQCAQLRQICEDAGIGFGSICLSGHRKYPLGSADIKTATRGLEIMEKALQLAVSLGIGCIQLAGYDVYYEPTTTDTVKRFEENLRRCVELAARYGVLLGFETMETPFMDTVQKAMHYVRTIDSPYLGVYPDIGNLSNAAAVYHTQVTDDLSCGAGHLIATHIKQTVPGKYRDVPFDEGCVMFEPLLATCWQLGVRRYVTELWDPCDGSWKQRLEQAYRLASGILDRQK